MKKKLVAFMAFALAPLALMADPVVTFFLKDYPEAETAPYLMRQIRQPDGIARRTLQSLTPPSRTAGIFSSYFGFINVSDHNGQTTFPRKHSNAKLNLIITDKIMPLMMFQSTVSHWELIPSTPAVLYQLEQKEDPTTQLTYWHVDQGTLPSDNKISPTDSIIIFAKPPHIYVPLGVSIVQPGPNLILPDMYVKKGINITRNALYVLNLTFLFRPIDLLYKKEPKAYESLVETE